MTQAKAARIKPDSSAIAYGAAGLATAIYLGAFATSFFGQASLAAYMQIPEPIHFIVPIVIDLALVLFTLATLVRRSRKESTVFTNGATTFWTLVSVAANVLHVLVPAGEPAAWTAGTYVGATLSALMPLAALGSSLVVESVLIEPASKSETVAEPVAAQVQVKDPVVKPVARAAVITPAPLPEPQVPVASRPAPVARVQEQSPAQQLASKKNGEWSVLSMPERAERVRALGERGMSIPKIAEALGTSESTVKRLKQLQPV